MRRVWMLAALTLCGCAAREPVTHYGWAASRMPGRQPTPFLALLRPAGPPLLVVSPQGLNGWGPDGRVWMVTWRECLLGKRSAD
jgi:ABC-type proline/glycine betaine transport system substrate-binding protein